MHMKVEWNTAKKMTPEELKEFIEFRENETMEEWIRRQCTTYKDPWRGVKNFIKKHDDERLQKWIDEHRITKWR